jgi:2-succinyl-6-hydroxy-2,4-cyclohexadiene-1-carboxylate synthase
LIGIISDMSDAPPLVFLPGFMQHADAWAEVAEAVAERYPSKVLDFGTWTFEERLAEIGAAAPDGSVLVGYSMGGRLALHAALRSPSHFRGLVVVGASAGIDDERARERRRASDEELAAWIESRTIEEVVARWERNPVFATQGASLVAAQRAGRLAHAPGDLAQLMRSAGQGACPPVWRELAQLDLPVLAVAGADDRDYAAAAERLARTLPRGRALVVAGAGHAVHLERPEAVRDAILGFVGELWPP